MLYSLRVQIGDIQLLTEVCLFVSLNSLLSTLFDDWLLYQVLGGLVHLVDVLDLLSELKLTHSTLTGQSQAMRFLEITKFGLLGCHLGH